MKTNIQTIIAICALGIFGTLNSAAISDAKKVLVNNKAEISANEFEMTDLAFSYSPETFATIDFEKELEEYASIENIAEEITLTEEFVNYSAQDYSEQDIENEIEEHAGFDNLTIENILTDEAVIYSAQRFSDCDFENELKNR